MSKVLGILFLVLLVWLGAEVATKGVDGAFGGVFAAAGASGDSEPSTPPIDQLRERMQQNVRTGTERSTQGLDEVEFEEIDAEDAMEQLESGEIE